MFISLFCLGCFIEDILVKISFLVSIVGLIGLMLFVNLSGIKETYISDFSTSGSDVKITGEITSIKSSEKVSTITIQQSCNVDIIVFDNISNLEIKKGDKITVSGQKKEENNEYQIYADEILLNN